VVAIAVLGSLTVLPALTADRCEVIPIASSKNLTFLRKNRFKH
jgi:hypothetical protein